MVTFPRQKRKVVLVHKPAMGYATRMFTCCLQTVLWNNGLNCT